MYTAVYFMIRVILLQNELTLITFWGHNRQYQRNVDETFHPLLYTIINNQIILYESVVFN